MVNLKMFAVVAALSGLAVGVFAAVSRQEKGFSETVISNRASKLEPVTEGLKSGNAFYLNYENWHGWANASGSTWVYFMYSANEEKNQWVEMTTEIPNLPYFYVCEVPASDVTFDKVLMVRAAKTWEVGNFGTLWNQTNDYYPVGTENCFKVSDPSGATKVSAELYNQSAASRISLWHGAEINPWMEESFCNPLGNTDGIEDAWETSRISYLSIVGNDVKAYFSRVDAGSDNTAARYDHILSAYHFTDFASRG